MYRHQHLSDEQLRQLLFDSDDGPIVNDATGHVADCESCQRRLMAMAKHAEFETQLGDLLSNYTPTNRSLANLEVSPSSCVHARSEGESVAALLAPPVHPEMLGRIGRYDIERQLGFGGMGIVFKAYDTELNRPVAIKILAPHLARNGAARQRFNRESRAAAAVVHEHVVAIHNVEADANPPYLVMQYVSGESLQARIDRQGPMPTEQILSIGIQIAKGLSAAHQQGIIHRDIKPANMMLEESVDRLLITDFGLARAIDDASLTKTGVVAGTPHYMSPEQASGETVDHRTDLFSLGSLLYFVATGNPPFRAERAMGVLNRICHERHRSVWQVMPELPDGLSEIIDRLLEKRPARRYASAADVERDLTNLLQRLRGRKPMLIRKLRTWVRRHPFYATFLIASLFLAIGSVGLPVAYARLVAWFQTSSLQPMVYTAAHPSDSDQVERQAERTSTLSSAPSESDLNNFDQSLIEISRAIQTLESQTWPDENNDSDSFYSELQSIDRTFQQIDPTTSSTSR